MWFLALWQGLTFEFYLRAVGTQKWQGDHKNSPVLYSSENISKTSTAFVCLSSPLALTSVFLRRPCTSLMMMHVFLALNTPFSLENQNFAGGQNPVCGELTVCLSSSLPEAFCRQTVNDSLVSSRRKPEQIELYLSAFPLPRPSVLSTTSLSLSTIFWTGTASPSVSAPTAHATFVVLGDSCEQDVQQSYSIISAKKPHLMISLHTSVTVVNDESSICKYIE